MTQPVSLQRHPVDASQEIQQRSLLDLMSDGFYMLLLLKRGQYPVEQQAFTEAVRQFLTDFEHNASREGIANTDIHAAKYAYCAMVDEAVLRSDCAFKEEWSRNPLQLILFGDHLAGENFFSRLEELRVQGEPRLPSLEVYYYCLLLGFQGKYLIEGAEKLHYLTARLGDEIIYLKGKKPAFAPYWKRPDAVAHTLRRIVPIWAAAAVIAVVCVIGYGSLRYSLDQQVDQQLAINQHFIQMPSKVANITITLP